LNSEHLFCHKYYLLRISYIELIVPAPKNCLPPLQMETVSE
jgi:hypothetical protein